MKKLLGIISLVFLVSGSVYSQSRMSEAEREEAIARYQANMDELNLTEEQKPQVEEINMKYLDGLSKLKKSNGSRLDKYRTFKDLSATRDSEMKKVLSKEQYAIFKENQKEQREHMKERRRNRR